jgi:hypothetical protein
MSGDEFTRPFRYDQSPLYELNGRLDHAETMYKRAIALDMNDDFLKAISSVR